MADKTIRIKGEFDASGILASFKKIRDEAAKGGIGDKMLSGYDKELEKAEKLTTQMMALLSKGLNNATDIREFTRTINQLEKSYSVLNVKAASFADTNNYEKLNAEIRKYASELDLLVKKQNELKKVAASLITAKGEKLKLDKEEINLLKKALDNAEAYKKIVDDITAAKAKALLQDINKAAIGSQAGLKVLATTGIGNNFEFGVAAKKGRDANRENLAKKGVIDAAAALAAAEKEYLQILLKTMQESGSAEDAIKEFTEVMRKYKLEVANADEVLELFAQDMEKIANAGLNTPWHKDGTGGIEASKKKNYTLRRDAINNINDALVNDADVLAYLNGREKLILLTDLLTEAEKRHALQLQTTTDNVNKERTAAEQAGNTEIDKRRLIIAEALKYVSLQQSIENGFNRIGQGAKQILSVTTSWSALRNVVKSTFNDIKDLDKAFGSIAMVTSYSVKDMWALYDLYAAMANKLGLSTKSVVEASALYYQQGLKTNLVMLLTEETMKLATLAGLDFKDATSQMTAALRAFHMDMSEGAHVTDVYAEVAAHAAVDVQGLSEAMSACASIANSSGMSFEKTTAMLATMTEATQEAPKNLGTALKTVLARFTELKTNVAGTAESEFDDLDYNKVDKALKSVGVLLKDTNGLFRNMDDVLLELSSKWSSLDRNSLRYIATIAAGSRQQSRFIALMENYERTMQLVDVALNSAGRSSLQFAKYLDTVEYRLNKISNTWELFKTGLLSSDFYKDVLDNFNSFLNKLNNTSVAGLATLAGTWMTFGRKAISGNLNMISSGVGLIFAGEKAKNKFFQKNLYNENYLPIYNTKEQRLEANNEELEKGWEEQKAKMALKGLAIGTAIATNITAAITTGLVTDSPAKAGLLAFGSTIITNVMAGALTAGVKGAVAGAIVSVATGAISSIISKIRANIAEEKALLTENKLKKVEKDLENVEKNIENLLSLSKENKVEITNLEDIKKEYDEIKGKLFLTNEEQEKFNKLVETLLNEYPELISVYDKETNALTLLNELLEDKIRKTKELQEETNKQLLFENIYKENLLISLEKLTSDKKIGELSKKYSTKIELGDIGIPSLEFNLKIFSLMKKNNNDINKTAEEMKKLYNITIEDLEKLIEALKSYKPEDLIENYKNGALSYIQNSTKENIRNATSTQKNALAEVTAYKYKNTKEEIGQNYQNLNFSKLEELTGFGFIPISGFMQRVAKNRQDYDDLSQEIRTLLKEIGIKTEDEYKEFLKNNPTETELANDFISRLTSLAISKTELTDEEIDKTKAFDLLLNSAFNSNKTVKEVQSYFGAINEKITNELDKNLKKAYENLYNSYKLNFDTYQDFLSQYNLKDTKWNNIDYGKTQETSKNLSEYLNLFKNDPKIRTEIASALYDAIENSGLSGKGLEALYDINYADLSKGSFEDAVDIIAERLEAADPKFKDVGKGYAKNVLLGLTDKGLISFITTSADTLTKSILDKLDANLELIETFGSIVDKYLSDYKEKGHIDMSNIKDIRDKISSMGLEPDNFIKTTNYGNYLLDYESLLKAAKDQLGTEDEFVEKKKEELKLGIKLLELEIAMLEAEKNGLDPEQAKLKVEKDITELKYAQAKLEGRATEEMEAIIKDARLTSGNDNEEYKKILDLKINGLKELKKLLENENVEEKAKKEFRALMNYLEEKDVAYQEGIEELKKSNDDAYDDWLDKVDAVKDAQKSLAEAIETVKEKQKELADVIKGTDWESSLDGMYNYDTALDALTKKTERVKEELDKSMDEASAKRNALIYGLSLLDLKANIQAQIEVYKKAITNYNKTYREKLGPELNKWEEQSKTKFDPSKYVNLNNKTGRYEISMDKLQKDLLPKEVKSWIEEYIKTVNEYLGKIEDFLDQEKELDEEYLEWKKQVRDDYIDLQQKMMDVLREKYQKEIDDLLNKYDAMEEADLNYLDALLKNLDKQRKLRDLENSWNELADKERKLSLMLRDTSHGNIGEVKSLEKEVEDLRTSLLDTAVDDIIEKLQEFYDLLKESRDAEIEYKETLLSDVNLLKEVTEELKKIHTSQDLVNWWKKNVSNIALMSEEEFNREKDEWSDLIKAKQNYSASIDETFKKSIENAEGKLKDVAEETEKVVKTTSEEITNLADVTLKEAADEYKEALKAAKDALLDAVDAVKTLREALLSAIEAAEASKKAFDDIHKAYMEKLAEKEKPELILVIYVNGEAYTNQTAANRASVSAALSGHDGTLTKGTIDKGSQEHRDAINRSKTDNSTSVFEAKEFKYVDEDRKEIYAAGSSKWSAYQSSHVDYRDGTVPKGRSFKVKVPSGTEHGVITLIGSKEGEFVKAFETEKAAQEWIDRQKPTRVNSAADAEIYNKWSKYRAFAEGGLVNYTGPAWVDGSRSKPEAFLSSEDTRRIGEAARILADLPILSQPVKEQVPTTTIGDTTIQIDVHVDSIANDYDLDEAIDKVEKRIVEAAKYAGSNVILKKH